MPNPGDDSDLGFSGAPTSTGGVTIGDEASGEVDGALNLASPADAPVSGNNPYIPAYQRPSLMGTRLRAAAPVAGHPDSIAYVSDADPKTVNIVQPANYTDVADVHERTHQYQDTRNRNFLSSLPLPSGDPNTEYNYGGVEGLEAERAAGNSIANASVEQQAKIQENWAQIQSHYADLASHGQLSRQDASDYDRYKSAYGWAIGQLARVPKQQPLGLNFLNGMSMDTTPAPPGAPPAAASGIVTDIPEDGRPAVLDRNLMSHPRGINNSSLLIRPGNGQTASKQTAVAYYAKSGGDPAKTRAAMQAHGWRIPGANGSN